jgi:hypothetical protein
MDKHTPLTKITRNKESKNPHRKKDNIQRKESKSKKSKVPLIPAQKNKYHYDKEQKKKNYKKISCLDMADQTAKN